jgi:ubiquinone/menaquinone biosynthesis C-methylase UbiE
MVVAAQTSDRRVAEQVAALAVRYSQRAEAYDRLWSPAILPFGERLLQRLPLATASDVLDVGTGAGALLQALRHAAPNAMVLGVDNAEGMLELARQRHTGPLTVMDVEHLELPDDSFDVAVIVFVLFHLAHPERCLAEVFRVLRPGGSVGTCTWGAERFPDANAVWQEELDAAGAPALALPAVDSRAATDSESKMAQLFTAAGLTPVDAWTETLVHRWAPEVHFEHQLLVASRSRLEALDQGARERCLGAIRTRVASMGAAAFVFEGDVVSATAVKHGDAS